MKRKSTIGLTDGNDMKSAVGSVLDEGLFTKSAAVRYNISRPTLRRYIKKCRDININWDEPEFPKMKPNYECRKSFTDIEEVELREYPLKCGKLHQRSPPKAARKLAYDLQSLTTKIFRKAGNVINLLERSDLRCS
ncbi:hypothetical protein JTB14_006042 [Gonioctena quinquepunctata]|nr:hypothetical protein JTB14_006042 [Gonioctena quinquepunctata]